MATRASRIDYEQAKGIAEKVSRATCACDLNTPPCRCAGAFCVDWSWLDECDAYNDGRGGPA